MATTGSAEAKKNYNKSKKAMEHGTQGFLHMTPQLSDALKFNTAKWCTVTAEQRHAHKPKLLTGVCSALTIALCTQTNGYAW